MNDQLMTVQEVADYLNITEWTVRKYIRQGKLTADKIGNGGNKGRKEYRVLREDVIKFLKGEK